MKAWLTSRGVPFIDQDVVADPEALKLMVEISGSRRVPVVQIGKHVLLGFDESELASLISEK